MKSLVVKVALGATLLGSPASTFAQRDLARDTRVRETTLLTGPHLLSPASPASSPMPNQEWVFIDAQGKPQTLKLREGSGALPVGGFRFIREVERPAGGSANPADLEQARERLSTAKERLEKLKAQREAALARKRELDEAIKRLEEESLERMVPPGRLFLRENLRPLPLDTTRFDAQLQPTSTQLSKKRENAAHEQSPPAPVPKN